MKVILTQNEIFQAISDFVRSKWKVEEAASVDISLTAGRTPKGHTAEVEITYPEASLGSNVTTRVQDEQPDLLMVQASSTPHAEALSVPSDAAVSETVGLVTVTSDPAASATKSADDIFN